MQFFVFKFISLWTYFYWHGSNTEYAVNIIFFLKKNAGDKYAQKSIHWSLVIQINFPNQRLHNKLSWTVCKWSKLDLRQRKAEGRLVLIRCETVPLPLTRVSFFWKVCVKKISNSIKRFNQITTLYLKKRVISNRNLISENIYVLEGLLNVSLTGHTSAAYLITNSNIWLFCLSFDIYPCPVYFLLLTFFQKWWFPLEMKRSNACTIPGCYTWYSVKCCFDTNDNWILAGCKYLCAWESFQYLEK